jgi:phosphatidylglycerol:prolipoprotein diacylglycerol transferase
LGPLTIYSYGTMLALAFIALAYLGAIRSRKFGIEPAKIIDAVFYLIISSMIGARALFVILNWDYYRQNIWDIFKLWEGGLVFYGGLVLSLIVVSLFLRLQKISFSRASDCLAAPLALGIAIGRIGCFLNGCCYGRISYRGGVCFPAAQNPPVFSQQLTDGLLSSTAKFSLPVLPTQLYESAACLFIFAILLLLEKYKKFQGCLFWVFLLFYSLNRFFIESVRFYEANFILPNGLTVSQLISLGLAVISAVILLVRNKAGNISK